MSKLLTLLVLPMAIAVFSAACSAKDPGSPMPYGTRGHGGTGTGGETGGGNGAGGGGGGGGVGGGGGSDYDAGPPPPPTHFDSGAPPPSRDAGAPRDSGQPPPQGQGNPGSCGNPVCGADGQGNCGCFAHDTNGNRIELGCSGTTCACFTNGNQSTNAVDVPMVCDSKVNMQNEFAVDCACN